MSDSEKKELAKSGMNTQSKALLIGSVAGGILGAATGLVIAKRIEKNDGKFEFSANEGIRIGTLIIGFLRDISKIG